MEDTLPSYRFLAHVQLPALASGITWHPPTSLAFSEHLLYAVGTVMEPGAADHHRPSDRCHMDGGGGQGWKPERCLLEELRRGDPELKLKGLLAFCQVNKEWEVHPRMVIGMCECWGAQKSW